jgi:hypothetical protein
MLRFQIKGKLAPRYIRPFEVVKRIGLVAYNLALPLYLVRIDVFLVSLLQKANMDTSRALPQVPLRVKEDLTIEIKPIRILD